MKYLVTWETATVLKSTQFFNTFGEAVLFAADKMKSGQVVGFYKLKELKYD